MTRAAQMKHGVPVEPPPMLGPDGKPVVSVEVAKSLPFARACVELMEERDGKGKHSWKLKHKAIWVPADLIEAARAIVEGNAQ